MLDRNGFMLPGSRAEQRQPDASRMPRRRGTAAVTALAVAPLVLAVVALLHG
jgi:hypothetical protein